MMSAGSPARRRTGTTTDTQDNPPHGKADLPRTATRS